MSNKTDLVVKSRTYAEKVLKNLPPEYAYHDLKHTKDVVAAALEIGTASLLSDEHLENLLIAAWFHDVGYTCDFENHEEESTKIMRQKMTEWKASSEKIEHVAKVISATEMPQGPVDEVSKVMCDADLYHLSTDQFVAQSEKLRQELLNVCKKSIPLKTWISDSISFLKRHQYFTTYGKTVLEPRKKRNIERLCSKEQDICSKT